jgi:hypothetical protein
VIRSRNKRHVAGSPWPNRNGFAAASAPWAASSSSIRLFCALFDVAGPNLRMHEVNPATEEEQKKKKERGGGGEEKKKDDAPPSCEPLRDSSRVRTTNNVHSVAKAGR